MAIKQEFKNEMAQPLTKEDTKFLRRQRKRSVCFDFHPERGISQIRLGWGEVFGNTEDDYEHTIAVDSYISCYGKNRTIFNPDRASYVELFPDLGNIKTFLSSLKVGDTLEMLWKADNNNQYIEAAKLHHDFLSVMVTSKNGKKTEYHIGDSICPQNSARMIKMGQSNVNAKDFYIGDYCKDNE